MTPDSFTSRRDPFSAGGRTRKPKPITHDNLCITQTGFSQCWCLCPRCWERAGINICPDDIWYSRRELLHL